MKLGLRTIFFSMLMALHLSASVLHAVVTTQPAAPAAIAPGDLDPINRDVTTPDGKATTSTQKSADTSYNSLDASRVILALGGVLILIFVLRWGVKKIVPGTATVRSTSAMKVVSRCTISPKQRLLLVQVGKRLVLVGDGGAQLNPLCQITDAEEVSALLMQVREESSSIVSKFDSIFGRAKKGFAAEEDPEETGRTTEPEPKEEDVDPAIEATRDELAGLTDKVRGLARQLGRA